MKKIATITAIILSSVMHAQMDFVTELTKTLHGTVVSQGKIDEHTSVSSKIADYVELKHVLQATKIYVNKYNAEVYKDWHVDEGEYVTAIYYYIGKKLCLIRISYNSTSNEMMFLFKED
jgi:hypothetical protein